MIKELYYSIYETYVKARSFFGNRTIRELKDTHKGERCFIVCTGPSLTIEDLELIKDEFSISMNSIVNIFPKTTYRPNIYIIQDPFVYKRLRDNIMNNLKSVRYALAGSIIKFKFPFDKLLEDFEIYNLSLMGHNLLKKNDCNFSEDFSRIAYDGFSVTYSAIQLAYYMGFKEIYLLGNDCNYSGTKKHFDSSMDKGFVYDNTAENMLFAYDYLYNYAKHKDIKIINATRGGKLETFPRINLDDLYKEKA